MDPKERDHAHPRLADLTEELKKLPEESTRKLAALMLTYHTRLAEEQVKVLAGMVTHMEKDPVAKKALLPYAKKMIAIVDETGRGLREMADLLGKDID